MLIKGTHYRSVNELTDDNNLLSVKIIDQRYLPFKLIFRILSSCDDVVTAISEMQVRGAPLIGITAAWGVVFACQEEVQEINLQRNQSPISAINLKAEKIANARPTAVNARYCVDLVMQKVNQQENPEAKLKAAVLEAKRIMEEDLAICRNIGAHGIDLIREISREKNGQTVNILTHCNAGWLATSDYGTATSPIYMAAQEGIDVHVWVDETRPRNQGARLTAWELTENGVKNTMICDNTGGLLMSKGMVDLVLVGSDRTTLKGDVVNKIGTYLKALAAKDNNLPFYVALPSSTIDWYGETNTEGIVIENRDGDEVRYCEGFYGTEQVRVLVTSKESEVYNPGFDVTPARLVTGLITERGVCKADKESILRLFPDKAGRSLKRTEAEQK
jgi:methylthioribose-1-phosphate isomerase